ncbi:ankyrin repeat domain-containing protein [Parashewanella tropica]|uniref:ankyrin repeat domain-containing protein n=1 Tax=Parashewanella tropica TaxID=2547970 RepID=UPI00105AA83C|nr:ankyrin repeat domain-containing protein [Parashewanella tropica]
MATSSTVNLEQSQGHQNCISYSAELCTVIAQRKELLIVSWGESGERFYSVFRINRTLDGAELEPQNFGILETYFTNKQAVCLKKRAYDDQIRLFDVQNAPEVPTLYKTAECSQPLVLLLPVHISAAMFAASFNECQAPDFKRFYECFEDGDTNKVQGLLKQPINIDAHMLNGDTLLMLATANSFVDFVGVLLDSGADANVQNAQGKTALHLAAECGEPEAIKKLLSRNANYLIRDHKSRLALHLAARNGHFKCVKKLINVSTLSIHQPDGYKLTPLRYAIREGRLDIVRELNAALMAKHCDPVTHHDVLFAVRAGEVEAAKLVYSFINIACEDDVGVSKLLRNDDESRDETLAYQLFRAVEETNEEVLRSLISKAVDQKIKFNEFIDSADGYTLFHKAAAYGSSACIQILNPYFPDKKCTLPESELTPLHTAALHGNLDTLKALCDSRREFVNKPSFDGHTPACLAARKGRLECLKHLSTIGAQLSTPTKETGRTPLHLAALHGHKECVEWLMNRGSEPSILDKSKRTALRLAMDCGQHEVVDYMDTYLLNE